MKFFKSLLKWTVLSCLSLSFWTTPKIEALEKGENFSISPNLDQKSADLLNSHIFLTKNQSDSKSHCCKKRGHKGPTGPTGPAFTLASDPSPAELTFNLYIHESGTTNVVTGTVLNIQPYVVLPDQSIVLSAPQTITTTNSSHFFNLTPFILTAPVEFGTYKLGAVITNNAGGPIPFIVGPSTLSLGLNIGGTVSGFRSNGNSFNVTIPSSAYFLDVQSAPTEVEVHNTFTYGPVLVP